MEETKKGDYMTTAEYAKYEGKVQRFFDLEGINCLVGEGEEFFSWRSCDCCGTRLGGSREEAKGFNPTTGEVLEYEVCLDCLYYVAYGQLDDQTMLEMGFAEEEDLYGPNT